ncbi:cysteine hydrolase [Clostridium estertheticum]|nr:cysteine hydrolase [Clostridium estertheticum]
MKFDNTQEVIVKTRQSTFIRTDFEEKLMEQNIDTLILGGVKKQHKPVIYKRL